MLNAVARAGSKPAWKSLELRSGRGASRRLGVAAATLFALALGGVPSPGRADSALYLEGGVEDEDGDANRIGFAISYDLPYRFFDSGAWFLGTYFEVAASYWDADPGRTGEDALFAGGLAGVLRYQRAPGSGFAPFVEFGVGPYLMSESTLEDKDFDMNFTFGTHVGAGFRMGSRGQYEVLYRFQHHSNAGIGDSNPGINFHLVRFGYWY